MIVIESNIQHCLGQELALTRMQQLVRELAQRFPQQVHQVQLQSIRGHRLSVSFAAYGYVVEWKAEVYDDAVLLCGKIPDAAAKFRSKIGQAIATRVEEALLRSPVTRVA
ncbi:MAG: polyhydroxyalkanoic acid system family protein [Planctomycetales bacterium]|nr:polyhydroxyalkanoic acid system family protein [Planctomycetales bacterium]